MNITYRINIGSSNFWNAEKSVSAPAPDSIIILEIELIALPK
jgi:hypothetical protein